jgi:asparagine synthase (glutamine-hydrolysing)
VLLSSGVDSSLVLDSAVRAGARPVAFTVGFPGYGDFDEAGVARRFAQELNVRHVTHELRLEFADAIAGVRAAYDQPLADASALATLAVARIAREEVTVALTGTGGDDLFAGYYRHRAHLLLPLVQRAGSLMRALGAERRGDERRSTLRLMRSYLARLAVAGGDGPVGQYLSLAGPAHASQLVALLAGQRISTVAGGDPGEHPQERVARRLGLLEAADRSETILAAIQQFETQTYLASDLLAKEDRATMAVGLEARVPMLGRELLLLAESLGDSELISVRAGKRPLRALAANRLPRFLTRRRKRGFAVPIAALLSGPWREPAVAWLRGSTSRLLDAGLVANGIEHGRLHPETAWAACALVAWESRLEDARADARHYDPR